MGRSDDGDDDDDDNDNDNDAGGWKGRVVTGPLLFLRKPAVVVGRGGGDFAKSLVDETQKASGIELWRLGEPSDESLWSQRWGLESRGGWDAVAFDLLDRGSRTRAVTVGLSPPLLPTAVVVVVTVLVLLFILSNNYHLSQWQYSDWISEGGGSEVE